MSRNNGTRLGMTTGHLSGKKLFSVIFLIFFLIVSFLYISPKKRRIGSNDISSQLRKVIAEDETSERIDYVDQNGKITIAADRGFATIITTKTENSRLERYYDEKGQPISRFNGYYAAFYEYDDKGNNIRISYLGIDDKPMIMANGYAIEEKEYNENGQNISVRYYDTEGNPILTKLNGYGKTIEYSENEKTSRTIFVDASGAPMMTGQGLAIIERKNYISNGPENGKVESEFYFNEKGVPVSLSLGQYGVYKEYDENGRNSVLIYLDENGQTISTNKGYAKIILTYQANANIATEQYFDLYGNPFALSEGQYGIKINEDQTVYLNQNGEESFNLKKYLYSHTRIIIPLALTFVILSSLVGRKQNAVFLIICITAIIYMTLLFRDSESAGYCFDITEEFFLTAEPERI